MNYFNGTIAYATTGVQSPITLGFQPTNIKITVSQKWNGPQSYIHYSTGYGGLVNVGGTPTMRQHVDSLFQDATGSQTLSSDSKVVSFYDRVSGTLTEILSVSIDSFTTTALKLNVLTANSNYNLNIEVWG